MESGARECFLSFRLSSHPLSVSKNKTRTVREAGKARRCAEVAAPSSARLWDPMPAPAGGWRPAAEAPGSDDPRSIVARLFGGGGGGGDGSERRPRERKAVSPLFFFSFDVCLLAGAADDELENPDGAGEPDDF